MKTHRILAFFTLLFVVLSCNNENTNDSSSVTISASESPEYVAVNSNDYDRFILLKNTTSDYIQKMTNEYGSINASTGNNFKVEFGLKKTGDWHILKVPSDIKFYFYHNLVAWFEGYEYNPDIPDLSIGFAKSRLNKDDLYFFYLMPGNQNGDTHVGVFRNGTNFKIYLPAASDEKKSLVKLKDNALTFLDIEEFLTKNSFSASELKKNNYEYFEVEISE